MLKNKNKKNAQIHLDLEYFKHQVLIMHTYYTRTLEYQALQNLTLYTLTLLRTYQFFFTSSMFTVYSLENQVPSMSIIILILLRCERKNLCCRCTHHYEICCLMMTSLHFFEFQYGCYAHTFCCIFNILMEVGVPTCIWWKLWTDPR